MKNCFVNLTRMTKKEHDIYTQSENIVVKHFNVRISGNTMEIGEKKVSSTGSFHLRLKKRLSDLVLDFCHQEDLPSEIFTRVTRNKNSAVAPVERTTVQSTSKAIAKTLTSLINDDWRKLKKENQTHQTEWTDGDVVMAKMSSYSPWPAKVEGFTANKKRMHVFFFGTNNRGIVDIGEVVPFIHCQSVVRLLLLRKIGPFHKSIAEVERVLKIPSEISALKELSEIDL